jgi:hypothetical protein
MLRLIVLAFGMIQLVLAARIAIDFGMLPSNGAIADLQSNGSPTLSV